MSASTAEQRVYFRDSYNNLTEATKAFQKSGELEEAAKQLGITLQNLITEYKKHASVLNKKTPPVGPTEGTYNDTLSALKQLNNEVVQLPNSKVDNLPHKAVSILLGAAKQKLELVLQTIQNKKISSEMVIVSLQEVAKKYAQTHAHKLCWEGFLQVVAAELRIINCDSTSVYREWLKCFFVRLDNQILLMKKNGNPFNLDSVSLEPDNEIHVVAAIKNALSEELSALLGKYEETKDLYAEDIAKREKWLTYPPKAFDDLRDFIQNLKQEITMQLVDDIYQRVIHPIRHQLDEFSRQKSLNNCDRAYVLAGDFDTPSDYEKLQFLIKKNLEDVNEEYGLLLNIKDFVIFTGVDSFIIPKQPPGVFLTLVRQLKNMVDMDVKFSPNEDLNSWLRLMQKDASEDLVLKNLSCFNKLPIQLRICADGQFLTEGNFFLCEWKVEPISGADFFEFYMDHFGESHHQLGSDDNKSNHFLLEIQKWHYHSGYDEDEMAALIYKLIGSTDLKYVQSFLNNKDIVIGKDELNCQLIYRHLFGYLASIKDLLFKKLDSSSGGTEPNLTAYQNLHVLLKNTKHANAILRHENIQKYLNDKPNDAHQSAVWALAAVALFRIQNHEMVTVNGKQYSAEGLLSLLPENKSQPSLVHLVRFLLDLANNSDVNENGLHTFISSLGITKQFCELPELFKLCAYHLLNIPLGLNSFKQPFQPFNRLVGLFNTDLFFAIQPRESFVWAVQDVPWLDDANLIKTLAANNITLNVIEQKPIPKNFEFIEERINLYKIFFTVLVNPGCEALHLNFINAIKTQENNAQSSSELNYQTACMVAHACHALFNSKTNGGNTKFKTNGIYSDAFRKYALLWIQLEDTSGNSFELKINQYFWNISSIIGAFFSSCKQNVKPHLDAKKSDAWKRVDQSMPTAYEQLYTLTLENSKLKSMWESDSGLCITSTDGNDIAYFGTKITPYAVTNNYF